MADQGALLNVANGFFHGRAEHARVRAVSGVVMSGGVVNSRRKACWCGKAEIGLGENVKLVLCLVVSDNVMILTAC